jgi:hypothetical protein
VRISVCIPVRDGAAYVRTAVASALAQDVDGLEVVVVDDGSRDATQAVLARIGDPRVRVRRLDRPRGVAVARNACLALARGELVAWLDADDEYMPGALPRQVAALDAHPEAALVHGGCELVDASGYPLPAWPAPFAADAVEPGDIALRELLAGNELTTSTVVARRAALDAVGPFDAAIGPSSTDWHIWLRLAGRGAVAYTAAPVARYRRHADTISATTTASGQRLLCDARVVEQILREEVAARPDAAELARTATAGLAARALLHAGDAYTAGLRGVALEAIALAERLRPAIGIGELTSATRAGADLDCMLLTRAALRRLARELAGTRRGARLTAIAAGDPGWDADMEVAARAVARATPADAVIAAIAKWDPALLALAGRAGCNFPDRELLPGGYPRDGSEAVAHLGALQRRRGVTHLVVPAVSAWWLEHYPELATAGREHHRDGSCAIFELAAVA